MEKLTRQSLIQTTSSEHFATSLFRYFSLFNADVLASKSIRYALVSKYLNSTVVDAKYSKHVDKGLDLGMDPNMAGSYMELEEQLSYKYVISIEVE